MPDESAVVLSAAPAEDILKIKLLLGEGRDEIVFFNALLKHLGIDDVQVLDYGGKSRFPDYMRTLPLRPGFRAVVSLGITRDADSDARAAFDSIRGQLTNNGLPAPTASGDFAIGNPKVGVAVLPDGNNPGMLEDLCLGSLDADHTLICVDEYFACVKDRTSREPGNVAKARLRVWLASQSRSDIALGIAAEKGLFDWSHIAFDTLKLFLRAL